MPEATGAVARWIQLDDPDGLCAFGMVELLEPNTTRVLAPSSALPEDSGTLQRNGYARSLGRYPYRIITRWTCGGGCRVIHDPAIGAG